MLYSQNYVLFTTWRGLKGNVLLNTFVIHLILKNYLFLKYYLECIFLWGGFTSCPDILHSFNWGNKGICIYYYYYYSMLHLNNLNKNNF